MTEELTLEFDYCPSDDFDEAAVPQTLAEALAYEAGVPSLVAAVVKELT